MDYLFLKGKVLQKLFILLKSSFKPNQIFIAVYLPKFSPI